MLPLFFPVRDVDPSPCIDQDFGKLKGEVGVEDGGAVVEGRAASKVLGVDPGTCP